MLKSLFAAFSAYASTMSVYRAQQYHSHREQFSTVEDCGAGSSIFKINSVTLDPPAPTPGQNMTLFLDYTVPDGVSVVGGQAEYDVTWNFIPLEPSVEPLCLDIPCPLGPGRYQNQSTSLWPDSVSGYITSQMKWFDEANSLLLCVEIAGQARDLRHVALVPWTPKHSHGNLRGSLV